MEKTIPLRSSIFGLLCTLLLCLGSLPAVGQNCPNFQWNDFTKSQMQPNSDCNTPGIVSIRYSNNIVGVDEVKYQFGSGPNGPWFETVDAPAPGATVKADIPASMNGKTLYVRITTTCGTNTRTDWWNMSGVSSQKAQDIRLSVSSTPAGSGTGASGGVQASLVGPTGFTEATFKLYKFDDQNTVIQSQRSTRPYDGVTFFNLPKGDYVVKAEAKPSCTPANPPSNWDTDHFNLSSGISVGSFNLITTQIPARGTCPGGVKVEVSKVTGVQNIEYTIANQSTPDTPVQTFTATYPNFSHTFTGVQAGNYVLKATEKTGNSSMTNYFNIYNQESDVYANVQHGTLPGVNEGAVNIQLANTSEACPAKLTITRTDGVAFTPIVKTNVTEEVTLIENLPKGNYQVKAEYGGITKTSNFQISEGTLGYFSYSSITPANRLCEASGGQVWYLYNGIYYAPLKMRITYREGGALVKEWTQPAGERTVEVKGLFPGEYTVTARHESSGLETKLDFDIGLKNSLEGNLSFDFNSTAVSTDFCGEKPMMRIPVKYTGTGGVENAPMLSSFLNGATFEIYNQQGVFQYSGAMPALTGNAASYIETPVAEPYYRLRVKSACGYPYQDYTMYGNSGYKFSPNFTFRGCGGTGTDVDLRVLDMKGQVAPLMTYKVTDKATGALVGEYVMKEGVNTAIFANMQPGDYKVEWWPQCAPTQKHTDEFRVEDTVKELSRSITPARCGEEGAVSISFYNFTNINAWRHELIDKATGNVVRVYGSGQTSSVYFSRVPAGNYIVKSTPIVTCGEITPGSFEVTVPKEKPQENYIYLWTRDQNPTPYQNDGKARYYSVYPLDNIKWRVLDVVTGAELNKGEARPSKTQTGGFGFVVDKLPHTYNIEFETPCGKYTRLDSLYLDNRKNMPGFSYFLGSVNTTCNKKGYITVLSNLKSAGLPEKATKIVLYKYTVVDGNAAYRPLKEETNPTSIIESHTFTELESGSYAIRYYYNGTSDYFQGINIGETSNLSLQLNSTDFSLKGVSTLTARINPAEPGTKMRLVIKSTDGTELFNGEVPADAPYNFDVRKPYGSFTAEATMVDGCMAGKTASTWNTPRQGTKFSFSLRKNNMKCKNDGEITMVVPESFHDVDQIHYTLTKTTGTQYTDVAETTKPGEPKTFIGLEAGTYKVTGRATVFKDENGQPQVQDFEQTITLSTPYRDGLYATVRPDYMVPTRDECPNGRIGLNIEKGSGKYRVFLTKTPDEGVLTKPREIFTDPIGTNYYNKLWGSGLKPGHYALTVSDGCMERDIPDAEILEMPNTPKITWAWWELRLDSRLRNKKDETRDSVMYALRFDPSDFPEGFRQTAYRAYEIQVVAKGAAPDDSQWKSSWGDSNDGKSYISDYSKRFDNCNGVDVLLRLKNCPATLTRITDNRDIRYAFSGFWQQLKCNTVQWVFTDGEIGHKYKIKVTRTTDNVVLVDKEVNYTSREQYLTRDPDLEFPADKSYRIEMTPTDYCGDPLYGATKYFNAINRRYQYTLDHGQSIMSDCDGRLLAIRGWTDCKLPLKYYAYEVNGTQETLVSESGNYVPEVWYSPYKFKKDKKYVIRVVEYGQPETTKDLLVDFTLNYRLPSKYTVSRDYTFKGQTFCGSGYTASKNGYYMNNFASYFGASWDGVPAVEQKTYLTIPKMTIVARPKANPTRKFVATSVTRYSSSMYRYSWKEELADGTLIDAYAPEGEYTVVAHTDCGDIPMEDDYIGRPILDLSATTVDAACDGKFTVTPKGTLTYLGSTEDVEITSFYVQGDSYNTTRNWGQSFGTYQREFTLVLNIRRKSDGKTCTMTWPFSMSNYVLDFDQSQSLSMFCTDSGKGIIHMALKGGNAPYTYKLMTLDGTEIARKTVPGAVDFEHGKLGERYRITATDACGLTWIHQDVLLQDPAAISSSMKTRTSFCVGDHAVLPAREFPGATYLWHLPDGSTKAGREIEFEAKTENAGKYVVDIHLTTCTVTLFAEFTVGIASITEADGLILNQQACAGEPVEFNLDPAEATIDGEDVDEDRIKYQWERTATPDDEESWTAIRNATDQNLTYNAAAPGVYYVRRTAVIDKCKAISDKSKLTVIPGINVAMTPDEQSRTINDKNPFTLTAGIVTGNPNRTYQWQRSADKKHWVNIGTDETFTETKRFGNTVYYRRIVSAGACSIEGQPITVRFKKRWPAYINPQVRQRTLDD